MFSKYCQNLVLRMPPRRALPAEVSRQMAGNSLCRLPGRLPRLQARPPASHSPQGPRRGLQTPEGDSSNRKGEGVRMRDTQTQDTERHRDPERDRDTERDRQTHRKAETERLRDRVTERGRQRHRERHTETQRETETQRARDRDTERPRQRDRQRETDRCRQGSHTQSCY